MRIEIASIGNEVLEGLTINTNAAFLSRELTQQGYEIGRHTVLPDDPDALLDGLKEALGRATLVVATGGLGPTMDDRTKQIAARLFRTSLHIDSGVYDDLIARFGDKAHLQEMARVPKGAIILPNRIGTAPGLLFLSAEGSLLLLPGEPREMQQMFRGEVLALLSEHFVFSPKIQTLRMGLSLLKEQEVDPVLRDIKRDNPDARIGIYPSLGSLKVSFSVSCHFERLEQWASKLRNEFGSYCFREPAIHEAVHHALIQSRKTLALAESCTGGALSARLVSLPDASKYLLGSLVVYSNEWKEQFLHVKRPTLDKEGAVSLAAVREMAQGLFHQTQADYAIAITGIAGPSGGSAKHPVGTIFIAVGEKNGAIDIGKVAAPPDRESAIEYAVQYALGALYRRLAYQTLTFL